MENLVGCLVMAGVSLPVSFLIARGCLRGLVRLMAMGPSLGTGAASGASGVGGVAAAGAAAGGGARRDVL